MGDGEIQAEIEPVGEARSVVDAGWLLPVRHREDRLPYGVVVLEADELVEEALAVWRAPWKIIRRLVM